MAMDASTSAAVAPVATANAPGSAQSQDETLDAQIQQCMRMLEGRSDEHKFAGLLMITKLAALSPDRIRELQQRVVDTVGVSFFLRLLNTRGAETDDGLSTFQVLGLNLIASFCEDPVIAEQFAQEKLVRFVLDQLAAIVVQAVTPSHQDGVRILQLVAQTDKGKALLSEEGIGSRVVATLRKITRASSQQPGATGGESATPPEASTEPILDAFWSILSVMSTTPAFWTKLASFDFEFLCSTFAHVRGHVSTRVVLVFTNYAHLVDQTEISPELLSSRALSDIRVGVLRFLRAKWPHQERDECLRLIYLLMRHSGIAWVLPGSTLRTQESQDEVSGGKFVLFILRLVGIETKLMLDEADLALIQMEDKVVERVDEQERQEREVSRAMTVLPICYGIIEMVIAGLVSNIDGAMVLPYDILLQVKQAFTDSFTVVLELLTAARDFMKTHRYRDLVAAQSPTVYQLDAIVYASVRVISAWIAEDSDTCAEQVVNVLPFLVCYTPLPQTVAPAFGGKDVDARISPMATRIEAVDSDDELDSDDEVNDVDPVSAMLQSAATIHSDDTNIDSLHFLLPGLLQFSATSEGAQVIAEDAEVLRRLLRFCCTLCANISTGSEEVGGIPTLTLSLGILMNLLLLRGSDMEVTSSGRSASELPNAIEWYRALSFLLPVACASGMHLVTDAALAEEDRGDDDRYVMVVHVVCVVLLIASHFQDKAKRPSRLSPAVATLAAPFNDIVEWLMAHPPDASSESATDLLELSRGLVLRSPLTADVLK